MHTLGTVSQTTQLLGIHLLEDDLSNTADTACNSNLTSNLDIALHDVGKLGEVELGRRLVCLALMVADHHPLLFVRTSQDLPLLVIGKIHGSLEK